MWAFYFTKIIEFVFWKLSFAHWRCQNLTNLSLIWLLGTTSFELFKWKFISFVKFLRRAFRIWFLFNTGFTTHNEIKMSVRYWIILIFLFDFFAITIQTNLFEWIALVQLTFINFPKSNILRMGLWDPFFKLYLWLIVWNRLLYEEWLGLNASL